LEHTRFTMREDWSNKGSGHQGNDDKKGFGNNNCCFVVVAAVTA